MPGKHDWNSRESYFDIHFRVLRFNEKYMNPPVQYNHTVITANYEMLTAKFAFTTTKGTVAHVNIKKDITIRLSGSGRPQAKTFAYRYHANLPDGRSLVRYCSPDDPHAVVDSQNHHTFHHKHVFDNLGNETHVLNVTGENDWPHVGNFLDELLNNF